MKSAEEIKLMVRDKYAGIASQSKANNETSCCGSTSHCDGLDYSIFSDSYAHLKGYAQDADLGLGCGLPTEFARIETGDTVVDLGSGAGNDCFVARAETGSTGRVIGIDMTSEMLEKAVAHAQKLGFDNVQFLMGDIEAIPLEDETADVVISNCVLNLVPDKRKAFAEILRILKPGGHFSVSDVVLMGSLPPAIQNAAEMYAGCVSGAIPKEDYLSIISDAGFNNLSVQKQKEVVLPDELLLQYLTTQQLEVFRKGETGIFSITVYAEKTAKCCGCGC